MSFSPTYFSLSPSLLLCSPLHLDIVIALPLLPAQNQLIAVFVDGCFWHGCPEHATWPKRNADFWRQKIEANRQRDADTNARLEAAGWTALRFWSHESPAKAAETVASVVSKADAKN